MSIQLTESKESTNIFGAKDKLFLKFSNGFVLKFYFNMTGYNLDQKFDFHLGEQSKTKHIKDIKSLLKTRPDLFTV